MDKDLSGRIQSVDRAMMILEALGSHDSGCRLTDLSKTTGLSLTTAHRLLTTLQQRRFVQFSKGENLWFVGAGAYAVGSSFFKDRSIVASAGPFLRRLRDQAGETANIGIVEDGQILLADQAKAKQSSNSISAIGARTPMSASGMGKAFLASYHPDEVVALTRKQGLSRITSKSLTSIEALGRELKRVEAQGYSLDDEEYRIGLRCVAAPVYNDRHEVVCAISVSGSSRRITTDRLSSLARFVKDIACEFTLHLGGKAYR